MFHFWESKTTESTTTESESREAKNNGLGISVKFGGIVQ